MLYEPSTLASVTALVVTTLREEYGIDPEPLFAAAGIAPTSPQARIPLDKIRKLWDLCVEATGDETIGLKTGMRAKPAHFYAFGYSWMASSTLLDALQRLCRYIQVVSTASITLKLTETDDSYALSSVFGDESTSPPPQGIDAGMAALLALCDAIAEQEVRPLRVELTCPPTVHADAYRKFLRAPVTFNAEVGTFHFDKASVRAPLPHGTPDIAKATDKIAETYIESLDPHKVASHVRQLLISLLPSGETDQELVSSRLNRSTSTLQRQLQAEGLTYREVLESTQRSLAETYLSEKKHSHAQIAYLLGFSEQSNFSRAFKRWTSLTPRQFQESMQQH